MHTGRRNYSSRLFVLEYCCVYSLLYVPCSLLISSVQCLHFRKALYDDELVSPCFSPGTYETFLPTRCDILAEMDSIRLQVMPCLRSSRATSESAWLRLITATIRHHPRDEAPQGTDSQPPVQAQESPRERVPPRRPFGRWSLRHDTQEKLPPCQLSRITLEFPLLHIRLEQVDGVD